MLEAGLQPGVGHQVEILSVMRAAGTFSVEQGTQPVGTARTGTEAIPNPVLVETRDQA